MIQRLLRLIGIGHEFTWDAGHAHLLCARPMVLWVGLALAIPLTAWVILRQKRSLGHIPAKWRGVLAACRVGVYLLLVFVLAGPYLRVEREIHRKPLLAVVLDESASMDLPAGPFDGEEADRVAESAGLTSAAPAAPLPGAPAAPLPGSATVPLPGAAAAPKTAPIAPEIRKKLNELSRADLVKRVIEHGQATLWQPLAERFDLRVYRAAREVRPGMLSEKPAALEAGQADETNLGLALERVMEEAADRVLSGVLLISDGQWTTGPDPVQTAKRMEGRLTAPGVDLPPVWTVPPGGSKPAPDVVLLDTLAPAYVAKGDKVAIVATIDSHGLDGRTVNVRLIGTDDKPGEPKPLTLHGGERQQVQLEYDASEAGAVVVRVRVDEQPEETVKTNNEQSLSIDVDSQRRKLLYLEGYARWDFRFLDHSLRRDSGLDTTVIMESQLRSDGVAEADLAKAAKLPQDAAGFGEYAVVMLGDISPAMLPPRYQEQLAKAVEEDGLGLIVQAGMASMPQRFVDQPLARLMPVKIERPGAAASDLTPASTGSTSYGGLEAPAFAPFRMKVTAAGSFHPALRLYDSASQNRAIWGRMPEFYWAADASEAGAGATVLANLVTPTRDLPLIAERYAGRGRVLFVGTDSTYRWRRNIGSALFYKFWGQALRHVAKDNQRSPDHSWIQAYPRRLEPGESVSVELYAVSGEGTPLDQPSLDLQVVGAGAPDHLTLSRTAEPGHFRGLWLAQAQRGQYQLIYTDPHGKATSTTVEVASTGRELRQPTIDRDTLGTLGDATGGGLLELEQLDRLPLLLKGEPETIRKSEEAEIWDNWFTLVLLVGLYCVDVGVRRLLGLT